jgi:hypothetical protein
MEVYRERVSVVQAGCSELGCRCLFTPKGRIRKDAKVIIIVTEYTSIALCPTHASALLARLVHLFPVASSKSRTK